MADVRWFVVALVGDAGRPLGRLQREFDTCEEAEAFAAEYREAVRDCDFAEVLVLSE